MKNRTTPRGGVRKKQAAVVVALLAVLLALLFASPILGAMGDFLVEAGPPEKADVVLVLAGDSSGNRIHTAAQLVREGYAPKVLVSGPYGVYGYYESELAIAFAEKEGFPASYFVSVPHHALSTKDEAQVMIPEVRKIGAKTVLLVTSDYHTRRAGKIFRAAAPDLKFYVIAAPDEYFSPHGWWKNRQGRKVFVIESMKTVAEWLGL